jgi:hypothetical protein
MLGRLNMDVDKCIEEYSKLAGKVFRKKSWLPFSWNDDENSWLPFSWNGWNSWLPSNFPWNGEIQTQYNSDELEKAIREVIIGSKTPEHDLLNDGDDDRGCHT